MSLLSCSSFDLYCILSYYCFAMIELIKMDGWILKLFRLFNVNLKTNSYTSIIEYLIWQCDTSLHICLLLLLAGCMMVAVVGPSRRQQNISFLDWILRMIAIDKNFTNFTERKNGGHFERRAAIGRRNTPHHSYTSGSKEVPACVRNIVLTC